MLEARPFREMLGIASVVLAVAAIGEANSQAVDKHRPQTPTEMAEAIALTISTKVSRTPNVPLALESISSHDNVVELRYRAIESRLFPQGDAEREEWRLRAAYRMCFDRRTSPLDNNGVVIRHVLVAPDNGVPVQFNLDELTCAAIAADVKTRAAGVKRPEAVTEPKRIPTIPVRPGQPEQE